MSCLGIDDCERVSFTSVPSRLAPWPGWLKVGLFELLERRFTIRLVGFPCPRMPPDVAEQADSSDSSEGFSLAGVGFKAVESQVPLSALQTLLPSLPTHPLVLWIQDD